MSTITFKALIDGVHVNPKKGTVKIALVATLHDIVLDEMINIGPQDEIVHVTFESAQTTSNVEGPFLLGGNAKENLCVSGKEDEIITEFPTPEVDREEGGE